VFFRGIASSAESAENVNNFSGHETSLSRIILAKKISIFSAILGEKNNDGYEWS
jgi:hypothetical protein